MKRISRDFFVRWALACGLGIGELIIQSGGGAWASLILPDAVTHWVMVEPARDYYIDLSTIQRSGSIVSYGGKYTELPPYAVKLLQLMAPGRKAEYLVDKNEIDCRRRMIRFVQDTVYGPAGEVVVSQNYPSTWKMIPPDSPAEDEWRFVCFLPPRPFLSDDADTTDSPF